MLLFSFPLRVLSYVKLSFTWHPHGEIQMVASFAGLPALTYLTRDADGAGTVAPVLGHDLVGLWVLMLVFLTAVSVQAARAVGSSRSRDLNLRQVRGGGATAPSACRPPTHPPISATPGTSFVT